MKGAAAASLVAIVLAIGIGAGYWWGTLARPDFPVAGSSTSTQPVKAERKILYYRNPMGLPDTSPVPKKDPMGMDYVAVYEGEEPNSGGNYIKFSVDKVQKLGVRSEPASMRVLDRVVKAAGRIEIDERRVFAIAPKFEGWVEHLFVNVTGQPVTKGQPLFDVYSPELVSAQREYAIASDAVKSLKDAGSESQDSMKRLAESSLARLKNWDVSDDQVRALAQLVRHRRSRPKRAARVGQSRGAGNRRPKPPTWPLSFDPHLYTVESAHTASAERAYASPRAAGDPATGLPVFRVRQASWHHGIFGGGNSGIRDE